MARTKIIKNSPSPLNPSFFSHLISVSPFLPLSLSPRKNSPKSRNPHHFCSLPTFSLFFLSILTIFTFLAISILTFIPNSTSPCSAFSPSSSFSFSLNPPLLFASLSALISDNDDDSIQLANSVMVPLPIHKLRRNLTEEEAEFWRQPDGEGYRPCLHFGLRYRRASARISKEKQRFLIVVVSGGLNQQRNQIVDAVVIARILEAALVVPVLQVNPIWEDESEFSDIFDVEHFKRTLRADVRVVSSLPSTHFVSRQSIENQIPYDVSPFWIRARFSRQLNEEGLLVLKGLDSKLSKNLPPDLQKLRCKVAFHALKFSAPVMELGNRIARRMWIEGPYIALHLRLEKDVWIRTGCQTGLGPEYDNTIKRERDSHVEFLTGKLDMNNTRRRLAGLCPLNAFEVASLLEALGAPKNARIYAAGGEPFGGSQALQPLLEKFPYVVSKEDLEQNGELKPYLSKASILAAIDYIVSLSSDIFLPSHGGNMGRAMQGHRAYVGHRKFVKPNKRLIVSLFEERYTTSDAEFSSIVRKVHRKARGQPELRSNRRDRDVIAYPVPECMCKHH